MLIAFFAAKSRTTSQFKHQQNTNWSSISKQPRRSVSTCLCIFSSLLTRLSNETAQLHYPARRRGSVAARRARATGRDAGDRLPACRFAGGDRRFHGCVPPRLEGNGLRRGPERNHRISLGKRLLRPATKPDERIDRSGGQRD